MPKMKKPAALRLTSPNAPLWSNADVAREMYHSPEESVEGSTVFHTFSCRHCSRSVRVRKGSGYTNLVSHVNSKHSAVIQSIMDAKVEPPSSAAAGNTDGDNDKPKKKKRSAGNFAQEPKKPRVASTTWSNADIVSAMYHAPEFVVEDDVHYQMYSCQHCSRNVKVKKGSGYSNLLSHVNSKHSAGLHAIMQVATASGTHEIKESPKQLDPDQKEVVSEAISMLAVKFGSEFPPDDMSLLLPYVTGRPALASAFLDLQRVPHVQKAWVQCIIVLLRGSDDPSRRQVVSDSVSSLAQRYSHSMEKTIANVMEYLVAHPKSAATFLDLDKSPTLQKTWVSCHAEMTKPSKEASPATTPAPPSSTSSNASTTTEATPTTTEGQAPVDV
ncbi:unnamed protein product [Aphanomyces euteiches]